MFGGDAEGVSDASAARQGGTGENRKATADGLRACEGKQAWLLVMEHQGSADFPSPPTRPEGLEAPRRRPEGSGVDH